MNKRDFLKHLGFSAPINSLLNSMNTKTQFQNEQIAVFDGWEYVMGGDHSKLYKKNGYSLPSTKFDYNSNWLSLMQVVIKIETIENCRFGFTVDPWGIEIIDYLKDDQPVIVFVEKDSEQPKTELIKYYYESVIEFLNWYENQ